MKAKGIAVNHILISPGSYWTNAYVISNLNTSVEDRHHTIREFLRKELGSVQDWICNHDSILHTTVLGENEYVVLAKKMSDDDFEEQCRLANEHADRE